MKITNLPQDVRDIKRLEQLLNLLFKYELAFFIHKLRLKHFLPLSKRLHQTAFSKKETEPEKIRKIMESMGGAFIKLGQLLSVRPDLIPLEYSNEFKKLQDEVKPFPTEEAKAMVESELKKQIKEMFLSFSKEPIAAASIGQVHEAALPNGKKIAVKVQRPGIRKIMETDIDLLKHLAKLLENYVQPKLFRPLDIVKEFERYSENELDYLKEAKNIDRFSSNFEKDKKVKIPKVYWDYTTDKVLVMDFIRGKKCTDMKELDKKGYDRKAIVRNVVDSVFKQVFIDGFFHGDPHPGNVLALKDNRVAFLDFGIVGYIGPEMKEKMASLFVSMINGDITGIAQGMSNVGMVDSTSNIEHLEQDLNSKLAKYYDTDLNKINIASLFEELICLARENNMSVPSDFVLLGKSIVTVEGFAVSLDPEFNLVKSAKPFVKKIVRERLKPRALAKKLVKSTSNLSSFISTVPKQAAELLNRVKEGDRIARSIDGDLKSLAWEVDKSSNRVTLGLIAAAFLISSALLMSFENSAEYSFPHISTLGFTIAAFFILLVVISIIREKRLI